MCLCIEVVINAVQKQEEDAGDECKASSGDRHPEPPGEVRVVGIGERRRAVVTIGETAEHCQRCRLNYNYKHNEQTD